MVLRRWYILIATIILAMLTVMIGFSQALWSAQSERHKHLEYLSKTIYLSERVTVWTHSILESSNLFKIARYSNNITSIIPQTSQDFEYFTQKNRLERLLIGGSEYDEMIETIQNQFTRFQNTAAKTQNIENLIGYPL